MTNLLLEQVTAALHRANCADADSGCLADSDSRSREDARVAMAAICEPVIEQVMAQTRTMRNAARVLQNCEAHRLTLLERAAEYERAGFTALAAAVRDCAVELLAALTPARPELPRPPGLPPAEALALAGAARLAEASEDTGPVTVRALIAIIERLARQLPDAQERGL